MVMAIIVVIAYRLRQFWGMTLGLLSFIMLWLSFEYIHFHWELSWPFMNLGNWLGQLPKWVQWYEYTGVLGGSLWILLVNVMFYVALRKFTDKQRLSLFIYAGVGFAIFLIPIYLSSLIINGVEPNGDDKNFLIVQPNINPYTEKYNSNLFEEQIDRQFKLAKAEDLSKIDCIIYPESSFPTYLNESILRNNKFMNRIDSELVVAKNVSVVGGFYSYKLINKDTLFYNTGFMVDSGPLPRLYHKSKLVIGVEKMPYEHYFSFLKKWNLDFGGYNTSLGIDNERKVFTSKANDLKIAPIICYESVYGEFVTEFIKNGATIITVITNDAWWGDTPGYKQHLMHSQLRAIECRRSIVRSANTGITCFINAKGKIMQELKPWKESVLTGNVVENNYVTFYVKNGDLIGKIAVFFTIILILAALTRTILIKTNR